ncbi:hypothetical protein [Methanoculleus chikugoensis]|uniref:hypothetical protein n=1 Tax=Methanoculleus chikugoensis TaxID=118126 RepID=UPI001FB26BA8|nr:hypothetical protein [Methanoculleus chikugoensis]
MEEAKKWKPEFTNLVSRLPKIPIEYQISNEGLLSVQLAVYVLNGCLTPTYQALLAFNTLYEGRILSMISFPVRIMLESWGAAHYANQILVYMEETGDVHRALEKSHKLLLGARYPIDLPWGGKASTKSVHVMDFIRCLKDTYPQVEDTYSFLCESCHPCWLMSTYWSLYPAHNNEELRNQGIGYIEKVFTSMECTISGITLDVENTLKSAILYIEKDPKNNPGKPID